MENFCPNCGMKAAGKAVVKAEARAAFDFSPSEFSKVSHTSKPKKNSTTSKTKKRMEKAKHLSELRQISKELAGRIGDLEIQLSRRLEEMQALSVRLTQLIETDDD